MLCSKSYHSSFVIGDTELKCWPRDKLSWVIYSLTFLSAPNMYFKQKPAVIQLPRFQEIRKFLNRVQFHKDIHIKHKSIPVSESGTSYTGTTPAFLLLLISENNIHFIIFILWNQVWALNFFGELTVRLCIVCLILKVLL